jgi:hypothetical protein
MLPGKVAAIPRSIIGDHAKELAAKRAAVKDQELEQLRDKQQMTVDLNLLNPKRARRVEPNDDPTNIAWDRKPPAEVDRTREPSRGQARTVEAEEWQPTLAHVAKLVEDLLPRLAPMLDQDRAQGIKKPEYPDGPREVVRDAILASLQPLADRYAGIFDELGRWYQDAARLKYWAYNQLSRPDPGLNCLDVRRSWHAPIARLKALPELPTDRAIDMSLDELRALPRRIALWDDALRECRSALEQAVGMLGVLRARVDSVIDRVQGNTLARKLSF